MVRIRVIYGYDDRELVEETVEIDHSWSEDQILDKLTGHLDREQLVHLWRISTQMVDPIWVSVLAERYGQFIFDESGTLKDRRAYKWKCARLARPSK